MKGRNLYFASVFSKELEKWKSETKHTQADFAEKTGIHPNMISRYKKGDAFPTPPVIEVICKTLNVNEAIFYPQTINEKLLYDEEFFDQVHSQIVSEDLAKVSDAGIETAFWSLFISIDHIYDLFPFEIPPANEWTSGMVFGKKNSSGKCVGFTDKDLDLVKYFQTECKTILSVLIIKELLTKKKPPEYCND